MYNIHLFENFDFFIMSPIIIKLLLSTENFLTFNFLNLNTFLYQFSKSFLPVQSLPSKVTLD